MNKILLIDGHSILNRAFYGLPDLTNSEGFHTNAILGFLNIMFKLMEEEKPTHICVAFDVHQPTFRHIRYEAYKGTRKPMPEELREQVPVMKQVLQSMNITTIEKGGYEADDIIGTLSRVAEKEGLQVTIISGDRDLLQLATDSILVRIPKTKATGTIIEDYYAKNVLETYHVTPLEFIDLKGLMGDTADNIPGVPGIGQKTAEKIIVEYKSIENAYAHIDEIKPNKARENLNTYYDQAILSKELATIKLDCELDFDIEKCKINDMFNAASYEVFKNLELKSVLAKFDHPVESEEYRVEGSFIRDFNEAIELFANAKMKEIVAFQLITGQEGLLGVSICSEERKVNHILLDGFITEDFLLDQIKELFDSKCKLVTFDWKHELHYFEDRILDGSILDLKVAGYLLNPLKDTYDYDDIARDYLNLSIPSQEELLGKSSITSLLVETEDVAKFLSDKACVAFEAYQPVCEKLSERNMLDLYFDIECPTIYVLYDMERFGIRVKAEELQAYGNRLSEKIESLSQSILDMAGEEFNILSPKQLGEVLFEHMGLPGAKKTKTGYSTNVDVLEKIKNEHPIIPAILEYRQLTKLKSTYADGLAAFIREDQRIHGKFHQTITATGRISSADPNLQNIPIRMPLGQEIRKVFVPKEGYVFVDADYSQIELRVLANLSQDPVLLSAFKQNEDIHTSTASKVFGVPMDQVTPLQRRNAKAVNFGIVYGISAFGLSEDLSISRKEAQEFIDKYFETYPNIHAYLENQKEMAKEQGYSETLFHRYRPIPELKSSNFMQRSFGERIAMNSPIQGTAADIIKIAMINVRKRLYENHCSSRLILQIHDELLIETAIEELNFVKEMLAEEMEHAVDFEVPLTVDVHSAENWFDAK